jgi:hypothetical protein
LRAAQLSIVAAALALLTSTGLANDFPTLERVQFVETCIRDHPDRSRQEMIYKCSCALDAIAEEVSYAEYVDLATAFAAGQVAGERGAAIRESTQGRDLASRYRAIQGRAFKNCLIP